MFDIKKQRSDNIKALAIDPGTSNKNPLGWCLLKGDSVLNSGIVTFADCDCFDAKIAKIGFRIEEMIINNRPDVVVYEKPFSPNPDSLAKLNFIIGNIRRLAYAFGCDREKYTPSHIKKKSTGDGNADKRKIRHTMMEEFDLFELPQKDEGDAIAVGYTYYLNEGGQ